MTEDKATAGQAAYGVREDGSIWFSMGDPSGPGQHCQFDWPGFEEQAALIVSAVNGAGAVEEMRKALERARRFISNGIEFGYISLSASYDAEHDSLLPEIDAALSRVEG